MTGRALHLDEMHMGFLGLPPTTGGGNVYGHTVGIGELKLAVLAFGQQLESDLALGAPATRDFERSALRVRSRSE
jgi:hypothetical protein